MKPHNTVMSLLAAYRPAEEAPLESPIPTLGDAAEADPVAHDLARNRRLREMVDSYVGFVARVLRNAGTPEAEIDDEVQRTFITASRRLDDIRLGAEKAFLFRIALNLAAHGGPPGAEHPDPVTGTSRASRRAGRPRRSLARPPRGNASSA